MRSAIVVFSPFTEIIYHVAARHRKGEKCFVAQDYCNAARLLRSFRIALDFRVARALAHGVPNQDIGRHIRQRQFLEDSTDIHRIRNYR